MAHCRRTWRVPRLKALPQPAEPLRVVRDDRGAVAVTERASAVVRPRPDGTPHVLAANVDVVGVVHALDQPLNRRRLERGIVLAWESGATPLVLLAKADLCDDLEARALEAGGGGPGVEVVAVSVVDARGLDDVRDALRPNRTLALLGASGAGKASLVNGVLGTEVLATQAVRAGDAKGRHTTTHRELVVVPGGGVLIDTPGLRALTVGAASVGLELAFPEIEALAAQCRFRDCRHEAEPGCAITSAVQEGTPAADHYDGWRRIRREADHAPLRADPAAWRARSRQWGRMGREAMQVKQGKDPHRRGA